jgi:hypothetical protein
LSSGSDLADRLRSLSYWRRARRAFFAHAALAWSDRGAHLRRRFAHWRGITDLTNASLVGVNDIAHELDVRRQRLLRLDEFVIAVW